MVGAPADKLKNICSMPAPRRAPTVRAPTLLFAKALGGILPRGEPAHAGNRRRVDDVAVLDNRDLSGSSKEGALDQISNGVPRDRARARRAATSSISTCTSETELGQPQPTSSSSCCCSQPGVGMQANCDEFRTSIAFGEFPPESSRASTPPLRSAGADSECEDDLHASTAFPGTPEPSTPEWTPRHSPRVTEGRLMGVWPLPTEMQTFQECLAPSLQSGGESAQIANPFPGLLHTMDADLQPGLADGGAWYHVAYLGGIELRVQPNYEAPGTGVTLHQNEVFQSSQEIVGDDGRVYLLLSGGRGWAFDDSALLPHDPSVWRITGAAAPSTMPVMLPIYSMQGMVADPGPQPSSTLSWHSSANSQGAPAPGMLSTQAVAMPTSVAMFSQPFPSSCNTGLHQDGTQWHPSVEPSHSLLQRQPLATVAPGFRWDPTSGPPPWDAQ